jgi:NADH-ubiquinone oxidoreductase chain 6
MYNNLILISEIHTNGYNIEILDILSFISILCGILVITIKNPIVSVLSLIGLFLSIASYLILLGISFIGISYLLVYVGAVSILFLFILMLINVKISELLGNTNNSIPLAILISIYFNYLVSGIYPENISNIDNNSNIQERIIHIFSNNNEYLSYTTGII